MSENAAVNRLSVDLTGKVALVTGAGRGIGRACALSLARCGAKVIAAARTESDLTSLAAEAPPGSIEAWVADVTRDDFLARIEALPKLDILVNNAGTNKPLPIQDVPVEVLDLMLAMNVRSVYLTAQAAVRVMLRGGTGGSIVNMSSQMGHVGSPNRTAYCMTKHAVEGLTKAMAVELAGANIRVNSVAPTFIETPMTKPMLSDPAFQDFVIKRIALGRLGQVEDVADAVVFLASPAAGMITGDSLKVDGGWTAQ
jgi:NAD(P)-dependent dehydrogenase (short-subunit alcohol dehydrogenase family)